MDVREFLRPDLRDLVYHGVETLAAIAKEIGMEESQLVKVSFFCVCVCLFVVHERG